MCKGASYSENQNPSAYGFPQAARTTHGNEAALAWFAWHNATPRKRICQNRACRGRKPTRKQASVAFRSGGASSGGNPHPRFPWLPQGLRTSWLTRRAVQAWPQWGSQLSCAWSPLRAGCRTGSAAPICHPNRHCSLLKLVLNFALFVPVFHLDFWLVQVQQAISTLGLRGENLGCKRADDMCVL